MFQYFFCLSDLICLISYSPIYRTPRAHPKLRPGTWQEVGEPVHDGWGHRQGSYVLVDFLQLTDNGAGHQLQHMVGKVEGHCCPLREEIGLEEMQIRRRNNHTSRFLICWRSSDAAVFISEHYCIVVLSLHSNWTARNQKSGTMVITLLGDSFRVWTVISEWYDIMSGLSI